MSTQPLADASSEIVLVSLASLAESRLVTAYWLLQRSGAQLLVGKSSAAARACVAMSCPCSCVVLWFYYDKLVHVNWSKCSMAEHMGHVQNGSGTHEIYSSSHWHVQLSFFSILSVSIAGFLCSSKLTSIVLLFRDMKKSSCWSLELFQHEQGYSCNYYLKVILPEHCFPSGELG